MHHWLRRMDASASLHVHTYTRQFQLSTCSLSDLSVIIKASSVKLFCTLAIVVLVTVNREPVQLQLCDTAGQVSLNHI